TLVSPPVNGIPVQHAFGSVHLIGVQLVPQFGKARSASAFKGSPAHVSALSGPATRLVSGQLCQTISGGADHVAWVSCRLSTTGVRFLGILFPPRVSAPLAIGLPDLTARTRRVFHVPHIRDSTGLGALFTPEPAVLSRPAHNPRSPLAASSNG